jgi:2-methylcitrate dehydratase PrpD
VLTRDLATFIHSDGWMSPLLAERATSAVLDTLAVAIAGGADEAVRRLEASLEPDEASPCVSPWSGRRLRAADAATLYGMASHMLDYDDVSMVAVSHPSAPVVAALSAVAATRSVPGAALLEAFAIGTEVGIRLGDAMGFRHYELGFHPTSTLGTVGVVAALARIEGLDVSRTAHALAIAASMACGLQKNFGSMVKPLHVGLAASNGLRAVQLARAGVEGAAEVFESRGFLRAYSGMQIDAWPARITPGAPFALVDPGFEQKRYPCCYLVHKMIEATLHLRREHGIGLDDVSGAHVRTPHGGTRPLIHPRPKSGLNAKFSAPYAVIASLLDGQVNLSSFTDAAVMRPAVQSRLESVDVREEGEALAPGADLGRLPVSVGLQLRDGRTLRHAVSAPPGSPEDPITVPQLRAKWRDCLQVGKPSLEASDVDALFDEGLGLGDAADAAGWIGRVLAPARREGGNRT